MSYKVLLIAVTNLSARPNKQIMALAVARWDANTCAASPY